MLTHRYVTRVIVITCALEHGTRPKSEDTSELHRNLHSRSVPAPMCSESFPTQLEGHHKPYLCHIPLKGMQPSYDTLCVS
jgi:hypothetical protein